MSDPKNTEKLVAQIESAYPRRNGLDLPAHLPFPKGTVLLIDDDGGAQRALEDAEIPSSGSKRLEGLYDFKTLQIKSDDAKGRDGDPVCCFGCLLRDKLADLDELPSFDMILLDLSLGEVSGADPLGYQLLPLIRKFFPLIPIVAYTKYRDMGHIERAFRRGASWFLSKDEAGKLPAHHMELIDNPHWEREWKAIKDRVEWDLPVGAKFDDADKHLIWKTVEHMPGGRIYVRPLTGGIGGAKTLHASREINSRYDRAAPVVIKIDDKFAMLLERERYQRFIQPYLSNQAGRIDVPLHVGGHNRGAISYTYAGTSQGRRSGRREVIQLAALLQLNLPKAHQEILPASRYEPLFKCLLEDILRSIHSIDPRAEPSEIDFPNLVFGESPLPKAKSNQTKSEDTEHSKMKRSGSPLDSYMMRMPPEFEIDLKEPLSLSTDGKIVVYVHDIERGKSACIKGVVSREDGLLHRVDLKGPLGSFYAEHRYLRPMQPLWVNDSPQGKTREGEMDQKIYFKRQWKDLWTEKNIAKKQPPRMLIGLDKTSNNDAKNLTHTFQSAEFKRLDVDNPENAIAGLFDWLTKKGGTPRKALEEGRIGIIHGDMNLGNVMVERERGRPPVPVSAAPWLIDFARTKRDWIVLDYTQLELDLCMRLVRPEFFWKPENSTIPAEQDWSKPDAFVSYFLESPWQEPPCLKSDTRLEFVYHLMRQVRNGADHAGVRDEEYLASRIWQCLITHKILCGKWRKKQDDTEDPELQFRCVWSLKQAFQTASLLGWNPIS